MVRLPTVYFYFKSVTHDIFIKYIHSQDQTQPYEKLTDWFKSISYWYKNLPILSIC